MEHILSFVSSQNQLQKIFHDGFCHDEAAVVHVQGCALHAHDVHVCSKEQVVARNVDPQVSTEDPTQCRKGMYIRWSVSNVAWSTLTIHLSYNLSVSNEPDEMFVA